MAAIAVKRLSGQILDYRGHSFNHPFNQLPSGHIEASLLPQATSIYIQYIIQSSPWTNLFAVLFLCRCHDVVLMFLHFLLNTILAHEVPWMTSS